MDERVDDEEKLDINTTVPRVREETSRTIRNGSPTLQRRRPSSQGSEPGVGFVFLRHPAFRRGLQVKRKTKRGRFLEML